MFQVGITGGIGSGKSTVCALFAQLGVPIYDADTQAKWLMNNDPLLIASIKQHLGKHLYNDQQQLQRPQLAALIFGNTEARRQLEALVHPAVARHYTHWIAQQTAAAYTIKEAALLFESGSYQQLHCIVCVTAPLELRIARTMLRDGSTQQQVSSRIAAQLPDEYKIERSDFVIHNTDRAHLAQQVAQLNQQLLALAANKAV